ncbi:MAG: AMP-binding protein, partial [bacterium]|nr:AMP-binding protein [bacterium]
MKRNYDKLVAAADSNDKEREFWLKTLSGNPVKSYFPYDSTHRAPDAARPGEAIMKSNITGQLYSQVMKLSKGSDVKLHMVMTAGLVALLEKYTGNRDITIGSLIHKQESGGELINTVLVLRNRVAPDTTFKALLGTVRKTILDTVENQNYPLEILMEQLNIPYDFDGGDFPLFDVAILNENLHDRSYMPGDYIGCNIFFVFRQAGDRIDATLEYNPGYYDETTIKRVFNHYTYLLGDSISHPDTPLEDVNFLTEEEKKEILHDFNGSQTEYPEGKTIQRLFEEQAGKTPDRIAVVNGEQQISYRELNEKSNRLALILNEKGAVPGTIAAIMMEPCIEMMTGIFAILKAGAAYLPIDPQYPEERIRFMLEDSGAGVLVSWLNGLEVKGLNGSSEPTNKPTNQQTNKPTNVAYIIYTSGTTGKPKGVMVEHRNVAAYVHSFYHEFDLTPGDNFLQQAS